MGSHTCNVLGALHDLDEGPMSVYQSQAADHSCNGTDETMPEFGPILKAKAAEGLKLASTKITESSGKHEPNFKSYATGKKQQRNSAGVGAVEDQIISHREHAKCTVRSERHESNGCAVQ